MILLRYRNWLYSVLGVFMKLAEIQNGLSHAGITRNKNYKERACAPSNIKTNPSYGQNQESIAVYKIFANRF